MPQDSILDLSHMTLFFVSHDRDISTTTTTTTAAAVCSSPFFVFASPLLWFASRRLNGGHLGFVERYIESLACVNRGDGEEAHAELTQMMGCTVG